jgi:hypothetical protein
VYPLNWRLGGSEHHSTRSFFTIKLCLSLRKKIVLHLEHSFAAAETLTVRKIGQIPLKFRNVVLENDGGQSSPSCEKERPTQ